MFRGLGTVRIPGKWEMRLGLQALTFRSAATAFPSRPFAGSAARLHSGPVFTFASKRFSCSGLVFEDVNTRLYNQAG